MVRNSARPHDAAHGRAPLRMSRCARTHRMPMPRPDAARGRAFWCNQICSASLRRQPRFGPCRIVRRRNLAVHRDAPARQSRDFRNPRRSGIALWVSEFACVETSLYRYLALQWMRPCGVRKRWLLPAGKTPKKLGEGKWLGYAKAGFSCREDEGGTALSQGRGGARKAARDAIGSDVELMLDAIQRLARFAYRDSEYGRVLSSTTLTGQEPLLPRRHPKPRAPGEAHARGRLHGRIRHRGAGISRKSSIRRGADSLQTDALVAVGSPKCGELPHCVELRPSPSARTGLTTCTRSFSGLHQRALRGIFPDDQVLIFGVSSIRSSRWPTAC